MVSIQERFLINSELWWRPYSKQNCDTLQCLLWFSVHQTLRFSLWKQVKGTHLKNQLPTASKRGPLLILFYPNGRYMVHYFYPILYLSKKDNLSGSYSRFFLSIGSFQNLTLVFDNWYVCIFQWYIISQLFLFHFN